MRTPDAATLTTQLLAPRPNPFNPRVEIRYLLADRGSVVLAVFDLRGRLVRTLQNELLTAGEHALEWDGLDDRGRPVASGSYMLRLTAGALVQQERVVLVR
jgi:hypothetical protein